MCVKVNGLFPVSGELTVYLLQIKGLGTHTSQENPPHRTLLSTVPRLNHLSPPDMKQLRPK